MGTGGTGGTAQTDGTTVSTDFAARADFHAASLPNDTRLGAGVVVDIDGFPDPFGKDLPARVRTILKNDVHGARSTSVIARPADPSEGHDP